MCLVFIFLWIFWSFFSMSICNFWSLTFWHFVYLSFISDYFNPLFCLSIWWMSYIVFLCLCFCPFLLTWNKAAFVRPSVYLFRLSFCLSPLHYFTMSGRDGKDGKVFLVYNINHATMRNMEESQIRKLIATTPPPPLSGPCIDHVYEKNFSLTRLYFLLLASFHIFHP